MRIQPPTNSDLSELERMTSGAIEGGYVRGILKTKNPAEAGLM
jgi:hypothetical protein